MTPKPLLTATLLVPFAGALNANCVDLHRHEMVTDMSLQYLNRLSDLLFVMCRTMNKQADVSDVLWKNEHG